MSDSPGLRELQRRFKAVVQEKAANDTVPIRETALFDRDARLGVYQYAWSARLIEALLEDYPATVAVLASEDESRPDELAREYLEAFPSRYASLTSLGRDFPGFLRDRASGVPGFLSELARLEWMLIEAFFALEIPNRIGERLALLSEIPPDRLKLSIDPSVRLLHAGHPLDRIHEAREHRDPEDTHLLVHRNRQGTAVFARVAPQVFRMLEAALAGATLEQVVSAADDLSPPEVQAAFQAWVADGIVVDLDADP